MTPLMYLTRSETTLGTDRESGADPEKHNRTCAFPKECGRQKLKGRRPEKRTADARS